MKPYFAVLYDSYLESVRSRVLWMLLAAWTLLLMALWPLTISSTESYRLTNGSFTSNSSAKVIMNMLADATAGKGPKAVQAIYSHLDEEFQELLKQRKENDRKINVGTLLEELNKLLEVENLYSEEAWPKVASRSDLKEIINKSALENSERERLNRKLIELAFPGRISGGDGQATRITWANLPIGEPFPIPLSSLRSTIERLIFPIVLRVGLGIAAMLIAIIITSPMIPDMFQPGSLHLMLSKPISRSLLFLTKFAGGCIFVALNIIYLLVGLYLFAGVRLSIWNNGILWCIPLFIFMFMVYYSVSALVGLIWKNAIICVVVTSVFWAICFGVGFVHLIFNAVVNIQPQATRIFSMHDQVILATAQGRLQFWDSKNNSWQTAYGFVDGMQVLGPVWIEKEASLYYARTIDNPLATMGIGRIPDAKLDFARLPDVADATDTTYKSKPWADGRMDSGRELPAGTEDLIPWHDSLALYNYDNFYVLDLSKAKEEEKKFPAIASVLQQFNIGGAKEESPFVPLVKGMELIRPYDLRVSPTFKTIATVSENKVVVWRESQGEFTKLAEKELDVGKDAVSIIGCNDQRVIICPNNAHALSFEILPNGLGEAENLPDVRQIKQLRTNSRGQFAVLRADGVVQLLSEDTKKMDTPNLAGQGHAVAIDFNSRDELWVAHHVNQADRWDTVANKRIASIRPRWSPMEILYHYAVNPFYLVNPKPAAVNLTIDHMLSNPSNSAFVFDRKDLNRPKDDYDPWQPIWSNAAFIVVMLAASCWYLYRQDL